MPYDGTFLSRISITISDDDLKILDEAAELDARTGERPNRSATVRRAARYYLDYLKGKANESQNG